MTGLIERLRSTKPDTPGWWMVERDDRKTRPLYLTQPGGAGGWTTDWREGFKFSEREHAEQQVELWHRDYGHARSHGMMTEYYNPDGPEAAALIEELVEALEAMVAGSEMLARHYRIDLCNDVENGSGYHKAKRALSKAHHTGG
jgi:hypothetical protein